MKEHLPRRKNIRLKDYDYSKEEMYFITICIKNRIELLEEITNNTIKLTKEGVIVEENIKMIEELYSNIKIDEYIVMPNHIHIILLINKKSWRVDAHCAPLHLLEQAFEEILQSCNN